MWHIISISWNKGKGILRQVSRESINMGWQYIQAGRMARENRWLVWIEEGWHGVAIDMGSNTSVHFSVYIRKHPLII